MIWLVVSTPLKNMSSSMGKMTSHILWGKNGWNHQPVMIIHDYVPRCFSLDWFRKKCRTPICQIITYEGWTWWILQKQMPQHLLTQLWESDDRMSLSWKLSTWNLQGYHRSSNPVKNRATLFCGCGVGTWNNFCIHIYIYKWHVGKQEEINLLPNVINKYNK